MMNTQHSLANPYRARPSPHHSRNPHATDLAALAFPAELPAPPSERLSFLQGAQTQWWHWDRDQQQQLNSWSSQALQEAIAAKDALYATEQNTFAKRVKRKLLTTFACVASPIIGIWGFIVYSLFTLPQTPTPPFLFYSAFSLLALFNLYLTFLLSRKTAQRLHKIQEDLQEFGLRDRSVLSPQLQQLWQLQEDLNRSFWQIYEEQFQSQEDLEDTLEQKLGELTTQEQASFWTHWRAVAKPSYHQWRRSDFFQLFEDFRKRHLRAKINGSH